MNTLRVGYALKYDARRCTKDSETKDTQTTGPTHDASQRLTNNQMHRYQDNRPTKPVGTCSAYFF